MQILNITAMHQPSHNFTTTPYTLLTKDDLAVGLGVLSAVQREVMNEVSFIEPMAIGVNVYSAAITKEVRYLETAIEHDNMISSVGLLSAKITKEVRYLETSIEHDATVYGVGLLSAKITRTIAYLETTAGYDSTSMGVSMFSAVVQD